MKQENKKRTLKRARTLKGSKTIRENFNEEEMMSKNKLNKFREIKNQDGTNSHAKDTK